MSELFSEQPLAVAIGLLFVIVFCRAQATYWIGRAARRGADASRLGARLAEPKANHAIQLIDRWGLPIIPLSFLTVGIQTAVNGTAGLLRIGWPRYTLAMLPGCLAWAVIYATVGFAVVQAWLGAAARSPWFASAALLLVVAIVTAIVVRRRRSRRQADDLV